jgi:hypothetical protein
LLSRHDRFSFSTKKTCKICPQVWGVVLVVNQFAARWAVSITDGNAHPNYFKDARLMRCEG